GKQRLVLGIAAVGGVDDRGGHVHVERPLTPCAACPEHFPPHTCDNCRPPAAEVLDLAPICTAEPQPGVLNRVVGLAERPEHPVCDGPQMRSVVLELPGEPFLLIHVTFLMRSVS